VSITTEAWVLYAAPHGVVERAKLVRESFELPDMGDDGVLAEPVFGSWEGNMGHALERKPIDICHLRAEKRVVLGNGGVVRVLETGRSVTTVKPGQLAMVFPAGVLDPYGYPKKIFGYDAPGTIGLLARRTLLAGHNVIPLPEGSKHSALQWAAFSARYVTAWANWRVAIGALRLQLREDELPHPHVWAWGGGTGIAGLELAQKQGCRATMLSGDAERLAQIARSGVSPLDRRKIGDLNFDERKFTTDLAFRRAYLQAETTFLQEVNTRTEGQGVHIFLDHIGTAVFRATLKALAREGVIATAGWKEGQVVSLLRAMECIERHQHVHTHYARYSEGVEAMAYAEKHNWMPDLTGVRVFRYDEIPELAENFLAGNHDLFPMYSIAE
jgi:NADPH:quinone reductase-like Zn-dependent oxidoreductase